MLIGKSRKAPSLQRVRLIKRILREALDLPEEATITLTELTCLEQGCAPFETCFGLLRPDTPPLQHRVTKPIEEISAQDLLIVCQAWGFVPSVDALEPINEEKQ